MNIKEQFREQLLEHEIKELLAEGKIEDIVKKIMSEIIKFIKEKGKIGLDALGLTAMKNNAQQWFIDFKNANNNFKAGKLNSKNPNYDEQAERDAWDVIKNGLKMLGFIGGKAVLNYFFFGTGFVAGAAVVFFRNKIPQTIGKYFHLSFQKNNKKLDEFMALMEDMSYFHADDATQDEFEIG